MKKFHFSSAILATIALFTACGDDVTEVNKIHQDGIAMLDAGLELSKQKCNSANAGEMLYVTDSVMVFMCDGGTWVSLKGADGENGNDGESCMAKPVKNEAGVEGLEVTCGKTVVGTIWNGKDGVDGKPGEDGDDGDDGEGCEISREGNVLTITCGKSIETIDLDKLIQISSSSEEESSIVIASSSSANGSSSSEAVTEVMPSGTYDCDVYNCVTTEHLNRDMLDTNGYGEILDTRDDQVYKVVTIGGQVWMAQNLNYEHITGTCYGEAHDNCDTYGRLYTWYAAMEACPNGWHLPSKNEWEALFENVEGREVAGSKLKSKNGWNGEDSYGFAVLPAGYRNRSGNFDFVGLKADFWSSSEGSGSSAYNEDFYYGNSIVYEHSNEYFAFSVRCLRN